MNGMCSGAHSLVHIHVEAVVEGGSAKRGVEKWSRGYAEGPGDGVSEKVELRLLGAHKRRGLAEGPKGAQGVVVLVSARGVIERNHWTRR